MSQHDFTIANATFPATRTDLNNALAALASTSLGTTAPSTTFAGQLWYDSTNHKLEIRNEADDAWITLFTFDQTEGDIEVGDDESAPPEGTVIKEIYATDLTVTTSASGSQITLSESMANFDYLEITLSVDEVTNNYYESHKIRVSKIPSASGRVHLPCGLLANEALKLWGSTTTMRFQRAGPGPIRLVSVLGIKLSD